MTTEYTLYEIINGAPVEVAALEPGPRVIILGGIYDLSSMPINNGSWGAFERALGHTYTEHVGDVRIKGSTWQQKPTHRVYTLGPRAGQQWHEDEWVKDGIVEGKISPAGGEFAQQLLAADDGSLNLFLTYSTGSLLLQHINYELANAGGYINAKAINIAPIAKLGAPPEETDIDQISFVSLNDRNAADGPPDAAAGGLDGRVGQRLAGIGDELLGYVLVLKHGADCRGHRLRLVGLGFVQPVQHNAHGFLKHGNGHMVVVAQRGPWRRRAVAAEPGHFRFLGLRRLGGLK